MNAQSWASILLFCAVLLAKGKDYDFADIGASLSFSSAWIPVSASLVHTYNSDLLQQYPKTRLRYIAGFTRGTPSDGSDTGTEFIWIQKTPMPDAPTTPEQFVAELPGVISEKGSEVESAREGRLSSIDFRLPRYEPRLGAIIIRLSATFRDGTTGKAEGYLITTKKSLISINVYSTPANADVVFEQARGIVSTFKCKEDQTMPAAWYERLNQLLKH
jgi:hypothetical protein